MGLSQSSGRGNFTSKVTSLRSVVKGCLTGSVLSLGLRPAVRRPVVRTAFSAFKGPFLLCVPTPRTTWIHGFSRAASKINVDAELFARMPETPGLLL